MSFKLGTTAIGVQTSEGVVLAVEKRVSSSLLEPSSIEKVMEIDTHLGCAVSGMTADARTMIEHARVAAQVSLMFVWCLHTLSDLNYCFKEPQIYL